jgi:hypothetical protein
MYNALEAGLLSATGFNIMDAHRHGSQRRSGRRGAGLQLEDPQAKSRNPWRCPASLSAFLGITEPAIFGVNLRFHAALRWRLWPAAPPAA